MGGYHAMTPCRNAPLCRVSAANVSYTTTKYQEIRMLPLVRKKINKIKNENK